MAEKDSSKLRHSLLKKIIAEGHQITPDAFNLLLGLPEPEEAVQKLLSGNQLSERVQIITTELVQNIEDQKPQTEPTDSSQIVEICYTTNKGATNCIREMDHIYSLQIRRAVEKKRFHREEMFRWIEITLENDEIIPCLDLEPLRKCKNLQVLHLQDLGLEKIDLSALEDCPELESITISNEQSLYDIYFGDYESSPYIRHLIGHIKSIDLSPLIKHKNLRVLRLHDLQTGPIDLSPLKHCSRLEEIAITGSLILTKDGIIRNLDLNPLSECQSLRVIHLKNVDTSSIDLQPLRNCTNLEEIAFVGYPYSYEIDIDGYHKNVGFDSETGKLYTSLVYEMKSVPPPIDLSFFTGFRKLMKLDLTNNGIDKLDLAKLIKCHRLNELYLEGNGREYIDLTPARFLPLKHIGLATEKIDTRQSDPFYLVQEVVSLLNAENYAKLPLPSGYKYLPFITIDSITRECRYDVPILLDSMNAISFYFDLLMKYEEPSWKFVHLVQCIPNALGIQPIGLFDGDAKSLLGDLITIWNSNREDVIAGILIEEMCKQIDRGGTTIGVNLGDNAYPDLIKKIHKITELREAEMNNVVLPMNETVDYTPLWLTAYGNQILGIMQSKKLTFENVQQEIAKIGHEIKTTEKSSTAIDESEFPLSSTISKPALDYLSIMWNNLYTFNKILYSRDPM